MYGIIYDSMLLWYKKWYPREHQRYLMTSFAMAMFLSFNLLTLAALLKFLGVSVLEELLFSARAVPVGVFVILLLLNLVFGKQRATKDPETSFSAVDLNRRRNRAWIYMICSFLGFVIAMMWRFSFHNA
ncbi:MAG TPA: hypothetical protein VNQ81_15070 [Povalibacter sp.]|nr:hypothetical protein [Povalibacter sp.]